MLHQQSNWGIARGVKRTASTVQKNWAVVKSNKLPEKFGVAVIGHSGWSKDPDATARYSLAVSFEMLNKEISIYEEVRAEVEAILQDIVETEEMQVEVQSNG